MSVFGNLFVSRAIRKQLTAIRNHPHNGTSIDGIRQTYTGLFSTIQRTLPKESALLEERRQEFKIHTRSTSVYAKIIYRLFLDAISKYQPSELTELYTKIVGHDQQLQKCLDTEYRLKYLVVILRYTVYINLLETTEAPSLEFSRIPTAWTKIAQERLHSIAQKLQGINSDRQSWEHDSSSVYPHSDDKCISEYFASAVYYMNVPGPPNIPEREFSQFLNQETVSEKSALEPSFERKPRSISSYSDAVPANLLHEQLNDLEKSRNDSFSSTSSSEKTDAESGYETASDMTVSSYSSSSVNIGQMSENTICKNPQEHEKWYNIDLSDESSSLNRTPDSLSVSSIPADDMTVSNYSSSSPTSSEKSDAGSGYETASDMTASNYSSASRSSLSRTPDSRSVSSISVNKPCHYHFRNTYNPRQFLFNILKFLQETENNINLNIHSAVDFYARQEKFKKYLKKLFSQHLGLKRLNHLYSCFYSPEFQAFICYYTNLAEMQRNILRNPCTSPQSALAKCTLRGCEHYSAFLIAVAETSKDVLVDRYQHVCMTDMTKIAHLLTYGKGDHFSTSQQLRILFNYICHGIINLDEFKKTLTWLNKQFTLQLAEQNQDLQIIQSLNSLKDFKLDELIAMYKAMNSKRSQLASDLKKLKDELIDMYKAMNSKRSQLASDLEELKRKEASLKDINDQLRVWWRRVIVAILFYHQPKMPVKNIVYKPEVFVLCYKLITTLEKKSLHCLSTDTYKQRPYLLSTYEEPFFDYISRLRIDNEHFLEDFCHVIISLFAFKEYPTSVPDGKVNTTLKMIKGFSLLDPTDLDSYSEYLFDFLQGVPQSLITSAYAKLVNEKTVVLVFHLLAIVNDLYNSEHQHTIKLKLKEHLDTENITAVAMASLKQCERILQILCMFFILTHQAFISLGGNIDIMLMSTSVSC